MNLLIDDNIDLLNRVIKYDFLIICSTNKNIKDITETVRLNSLLVEHVFVNINLKITRGDRRLEFRGLKLMQQLGFIIPNVKFIALSFLDYTYVSNSSSFAKTILNSEEVFFQNYIKFLQNIYYKEERSINE